MVFVEIDKNKNTMKTVQVLHDIKTITAITEWNLNFIEVDPIH